jgi:hypothetical protein
MADTSTSQPVFRTVPLDTPIMRGDQTIASLQLRKPAAGELRGLTMSDLAKLDVSTVLKILPRISIPMISEAEAAAMPPEDLFACSTEIGSFLLKRADLEAFPAA